MQYTSQKPGEDISVLSIRSAVMFAFEGLSSHQIDEAIMTIPDIVMRFAAEKLTDEEFRQCLFVNPIGAYLIREKLSAQRQAMVLAASYRYGFTDDYGGNLPSLHEEIIRSITLFPEEWLVSHNNDFGKIFELLHYWVNLETTSVLIGRLLNETPEALRDPIARFCAVAL